MGVLCYIGSRGIWGDFLLGNFFTIVLAKFEVRSFTRFPEIIAIGVLGGVRTPILGKGRPHRNFAQPLVCLHAPFSPNFNGRLFGWTLRMYRPNLKSVA